MTLRQAREKAEMTQEALAAESKIDQTTISNIEVGRVKNPASSTVMALANALGMDPRQLVFGKDAEALAS